MYTWDCMRNVKHIVWNLISRGNPNLNTSSFFCIANKHHHIDPESVDVFNLGKQVSWDGWLSRTWAHYAGKFVQSLQPFVARRTRRREIFSFFSERRQSKGLFVNKVRCGSVALTEPSSSWTHREEHKVRPGCLNATSLRRIPLPAFVWRGCSQSFVNKNQSVAALSL